ncbi:hypothetical protein IR010_04145 [Flavobacterium sp. MR2016-29]|uniref:hypothetical protein n=1 Tax=Flavobacterium sp. MR2016-29 TaxID=2783795 RepID=UPI00188BED5D|nr:hypothetical protein [Flavobacterium sp. MR2016-29]MBF4491721.1 hypothetical protein [Flavobacterium sp. MR2016-29]
MKKINLLLLSILFLNFINCQKKDNNSKTIINVDKIEQKSIGFSDKYEALPKIDIEEISVSEYKRLNVTKRPIIKIPVNYDANYYNLETNDKIIQLKRGKRVESNGSATNWYDFLGFYPTLNMYAFSRNSVSESLNFSEFMLLNKSNGEIINIISSGDERIENPIPSSKKQYLAYFDNQVYASNNSFLGILKFDEKNKLKEYRSLISENFNIYQIAWGENDVLLIKTSSDNGKKFKYYKSNILSQNTNEKSLDDESKQDNVFFGDSAIGLGYEKYFKPIIKYNGSLVLENQNNLYKKQFLSFDKSNLINAKYQFVKQILKNKNDYRIILYTLLNDKKKDSVEFYRSTVDKEIPNYTCLSYLDVKNNKIWQLKYFATGTEIILYMNSVIKKDGSIKKDSLYFLDESKEVKMDTYKLYW